MEYEVRAEYADEAPARSDHPRVETWHMTKTDELGTAGSKADATQAVCGLRLDADAQTLPAGSWGTSEAEPFCRVCGAQYLRQGL